METMSRGEIQVGKKKSFPEQEMTVWERPSNAAEAFGLIERFCLAINLLVLALSFGLLVIFWVGKVSPILLAVVGLPLIAVSTYFFVIKSDLLRWSFLKSGKTFVYLILLGVLLTGGLYLRYPTGACIHGGQDQGSYFNIAAWMAEHGKYDRYDELLADAFNQNWPFALVWNPYKSNNGSQQEFISGEYEGERFFNIKDRKKGHVTPQFYPLTPLLLTWSYWIFGAQGTGDILPIFGVLSALGAALLAFRIWKNFFIACLVLVTLLVSGLEVFFSGFPVTEVISQYFIIVGIWLLLWGNEDHNSSLTCLAGLNFTAALFNHPSTIFYLVPLIGYFILYQVADYNRLNRPVLVFYYTFLAGSTLSLISARIHHGFYVYRNLKENLAFLEPLGLNGTFLVLFSVIFVAAFVPLAFYTGLGRYIQKRPLWAKNALIFAAGSVAFLILSKTLLYKFGLLSYIGIKYTYFSSITTHISLFGWFFLLWGIFISLYRSRTHLILFPAMIFIFTSFIFLYLSFATDYQWYYARYYTKELYPLAIIFICYGIYQFSRLSVLKGFSGKLVTSLLALLLVLYSAHPNLYLFKRPFLKGAYEHMVFLDSKLSERSIILFVQGPYDPNAFRDSVNRLSLPLVYSFGHDVLQLPFAPDLEKIIKFVELYIRVYQRPIYLLYIGLEPLPKSYLPSKAKLITSRLLTFTRFKRAYGIPKKYQDFFIPVHLYAL